jgi:hypothetical protein
MAGAKPRRSPLRGLSRYYHEVSRVHISSANHDGRAVARLRDCRYAPVSAYLHGQIPETDKAFPVRRAAAASTPKISKTSQNPILSRRSTRCMRMRMHIHSNPREGCSAFGEASLYSYICTTGRTESIREEARET